LVTKMKKIIILLVLCAVFVVAAPPDFSNHQFYGEVSWSGTAPKEVVVKNGATELKSVIKAPPCVTDTCKGKYGYDTDNILRVQGKDGDKLIFLISGKEVGSSVYKDGDISKLDFNLIVKTQENKTVTKNETGPVCGNNKKEFGEECDGTDVGNALCSVLKPGTSGTVSCSFCTYVTTGCTVPDVGSSPPTFVAPPVTKTVVETCFDGVPNQNEVGVDCGGECSDCKKAVVEKDGLSVWVWVGAGVLVLLLIAIIIFVMMKKDSGQQSQY
jgi:hypothetical protein